MLIIIFLVCFLLAGAGGGYLSYRLVGKHYDYKLKMAEAEKQYMLDIEGQRFEQVRHMLAEGKAEGQSVDAEDVLRIMQVVVEYEIPTNQTAEPAEKEPKKLSDGNGSK